MRPGSHQFLALITVWLLSGCVITPFFARLQPAIVDHCPVGKMHFTRATGCQNDGSFEFCLTDDPALIAEIEQMSPNISCQPGRGRAQCNAGSEYLCMVSTTGLCVAPRGALNAVGWQLACDLAAQPVITELVPTWYE